MASQLTISISPSKDREFRRICGAVEWDPYAYGSSGFIIVDAEEANPKEFIGLWDDICFATRNGRMFIRIDCVVDGRNIVFTAFLSAKPVSFIEKTTDGYGESVYKVIISDVTEEKDLYETDKQQGI